MRTGTQLSNHSRCRYARHGSEKLPEMAITDARVPKQGAQRAHAHVCHQSEMSVVGLGISRTPTFPSRQPDFDRPLS